MIKTLGIFVFGLLLSSSAAYAMDDCFPAVGDVMEVRRDQTALRTDSSSSADQIGSIGKGDLVRVVEVRVRSTIQIWSRVATREGLEGWVFSGYFSDVIHGNAAICHYTY